MYNDNDQMGEGVSVYFRLTLQLNTRFELKCAAIHFGLIIDLRNNGRKKGIRKVEKR